MGQGRVEHTGCLFKAQRDGSERGHGGGACKRYVFGGMGTMFLERNGVGQGGVGWGGAGRAGMGATFWGTTGARKGGAGAGRHVCHVFWAAWYGHHIFGACTSCCRGMTERGRGQDIRAVFLGRSRTGGRAAWSLHSYCLKKISH
ncbi:hypothetical protein R1flu_007201 [Riccia fluitans]|uniref:Glycine-rich protein n=1 Tax=Riccia fluitans TaxID=41844 RepID=A0ABD1Z2A3_9MARC